jgi:fructose-bisphosphate aldolase, class II
LALSDGLDWIRRAQAEKYAVGAFNMNTLEQAQAVVAAAQSEAAPAIIQVSHRALLYLGEGNALLGLRFAASLGRIAAESVPVPIVLHLDHGAAGEVREAIKLGFTSVMFDGGDLPYDANVAQTRELCELVHAAGLAFEAELGEVPRLDASGHSSTGALTDPEQAAAFVQATHIDALAIAIGSVHAVQRKEVVLDLERLANIRRTVSVPLVLHGSSGVTDEFVHEGILGGLCKVNVATQLNVAFTGAVRSRLAEASNLVDPRDYLGQARLQTRARVAERMRWFGCSGKAQTT